VGLGQEKRIRGGAREQTKQGEKRKGNFGYPNNKDPNRGESKKNLSVFGGVGGQRAPKGIKTGTQGRIKKCRSRKPKPTQKNKKRKMAPQTPPGIRDRG